LFIYEENKAKTSQTHLLIRVK